MALYHNPKIVMDGLVFCVDAANPRSYSGSGTTWTDISNNSNNGTLTNGPVFSSNNFGYFDFDGADDEAPIGDNNFPYGSSAGSLCGWANTDTAVGGWSWIISYGTDGNSLSRFIGINASTYYFGGYGNDITASGVVANTWFYMVGVYDGAYASIYINGSLVSGPTAKSWNTVANVQRIGRQTNTASEFWNGKISHVSVYNKALTATEITQNFNAQRGRYGL